MKKQVDRDHYDFSRYMNKRRWSSVWHQIDEVLAFQPSSVLEIGPGPGIFKAILSLSVPKVETLDLDPELEPDYVSYAESMPFKDNTFDVLCAFQMLEHVPYEKSLQIFKEMARVAKKGIIISLPDAAKLWPYSFYVPKVGQIFLHIPKPRLRTSRHLFDGEHYWEINKSGYSFKKVKNDLLNCTNIQLLKTFRVNENPYHRFFIFQKKY